MIASPLSTVTDAYENLSDREQRLVAILGVVLASLIVLLPIWFSASSIFSLSGENEDIRETLTDISRSQAIIRERQAEREATAALYERRAPTLSSFLEQKARAAGYERALEVTDQPDKVAGGYTRRHVRANLPGVDLRTAIDILTAVENSNYPVALERLKFEHHQAGDRYNLQLGVFAFDKDDSDDEDEDEDEDGPARDRAGPPGPR